MKLDEMMPGFLGSEEYDIQKYGRKWGKAASSLIEEHAASLDKEGDTHDTSSRNRAYAMTVLLENMLTVMHQRSKVEKPRQLLERMLDAMKRPQ